MASGHVNRTQRPNTWLHQLTLQRENFACQLGAVHTWHKADIGLSRGHVRFTPNSGHCSAPGNVRFVLKADIQAAIGYYCWRARVLKFVEHHP